MPYDHECEIFMSGGYSLFATMMSDGFGQAGYNSYLFVAGGGNFSDNIIVNTSDPNRWTFNGTLQCTMARSDMVCNFDGGQIIPSFGLPCPAPLYMSLYVNYYNKHVSQGCVVSSGNVSSYIVMGDIPYFNDTFSVTCS